MTSRFKALKDIGQDFSKNVLVAEEEVKFVKVAKVTKQTEDEYLIRINCAIEHDPGQFMQVSILGVGEAPISICSSSSDYFEMSVRNVGNVSSHICNLKKGDVVGIRGPYGNGYKMKWFENNDLIILGGGCGAAPVRGVIEYVNNHRKKFGKVNLLFGFRTHHDILFKKDFKNWRENNMDVEVILGEKGNHQNMKEGLITDLLTSEMTETNVNKMIIICGPTPMIHGVCKTLLEKGFNKDQIFYSEERHMKCGVGRCGHCMIQDKYCCTDGPVFRLDEIDGYVD